ncbi:MAG TPA: hypothetical protein VM076_16535, partial [Gemmatimonadaceae bacterium]|nr:hypothetical protein [Gemmatimonadaceae bacterium]
KAHAYTALADGYLAPDVAYPKAAEAARQAMMLDSTLAEGWVAAAGIDVNYFWNWPRARAYIDRARSTGLQSPDLLYVEANYWSGVRRMDEMIAAFKESARLDPLSTQTAALFMATLTQIEASDSAIAFWEKLPQDMQAVPYGDAFYAIALADRGEYARAEREFAKALPALGHLSPGLGMLYARTGRRAQAERLLADIEGSWPATYIPPEIVAQLPAALGDTTAMYRWLERGVTIHSAWAPGLWSWKSAFENYLAQPHFQDILRRIHGPPTTAIR